MRSLGRIILDDAISDEELRARLFAAVSREDLVACVDNIGEWVTGKRSDLFHGIVRRHGMLRKFWPALLDALEFTQDIEGEPRACLRALQMLKELNVVEWDNVVLYGQYILDRKLVRQRRRSMKGTLSV